MIELRRIGLINWHLLPAMDIDLRGNAGVIGENRSGKSTLLDMIQVVMTGNSGRYRNLNASANDSGRKRGQRTVHAYCLGRLSPNEVIRPEGALTYLFLVFGTGEQACTLGLALEASPAESDARTLGQFIAPGRALAVADFMDHADDGTDRPRDWALMKPWLETMAGARVYRDEPGKFVADYLKNLSTRQQFIGADRFQKAFVNAISFEQIDSATDFVRRYLLDRKDIRIGQLKDSIGTYQRLRRNIEEAKDKLSRLEEIQARIAAYKADLAAYDRDRWIAGRARLDWQHGLNRAVRKRLRQATADLQEAQRDRAEYDRLKAETTEELESVKEAIRAQTQGRRPEFEKDRKLQEHARTEAVNALKTMQRAVNQGAHATRFRRYLPGSDSLLFDLIERARSAGGQVDLPVWPQNPHELASILDNPALVADPVREGLLLAMNGAVKRQAPMEAEKADLLRRIRDIRQKGVSLERNVEELAAELEALGFKPRILCTLLEVRDESWRLAAEALLGRDREAILVDPAYVDDAIRHLQRNRQRFRFCRIVNTRKIDPQETAAAPGTLASILASDDRLAMAFVIRRIGNVRLAETIQDLHRPGRAIMRDGTYDDGLIVEMREIAHGQKIGAGAGRTGLAALERDLAELDEKLTAAAGEARDLRLAEQALGLFATLAGQGSALLRDCETLHRTRERLDQIAADIRALERNVDPALQARQAEYERAVQTFEIEARDAIRREADAKTQIRDATQTLGAGESEPGSDLALEVAWRSFKDVQYLRQAGRPSYRAALAAAKNDLRKTAEAAQAQANDARERFQQTKSDVFDLYLDFHTAFGLKPDYIRTDAEPIRDIEPWAEENAQRIRDVDLIRYESDAAAAAERTRNIFQHSFVFELRDRFDMLRRTIDEMNRTLAGHDFHYERYRFVAKPVELYHDIIRLVDDSRDDPSIFTQLFDADLAAEIPHARALATVRELLLDETRDIAAFEDYRQYYVFNMIMKDLKIPNREVDLDARRGTGSGAEQQVPFYVAIGTALAAAYHGRSAGDETAEKGIGLAVLDEAFAKLDGKNQKACMEYYRKLGLQVIVAAPFEKRTSLYETMDWFIETIRSGDLIEIDPYGVGERTRQAFAEANPANLGLDGFRRMAAEAARADAA